jgi:hypothetical protein
MKELTGQNISALIFHQNTLRFAIHHSQVGPFQTKNVRPTRLLNSSNTVHLMTCWMYPNYPRQNPPGKGKAVLGHVFQNGVETKAPLIRERGQKLEFAVDTVGPPISVHGDFTRLRQSYWNIIHKASKYINPGGRIRIQAFEADDAAVEVADSGVGIPQSYLDRIFDMFSQVETDSTRYNTRSSNAATPSAMPEHVAKSRSAGFDRQSVKPVVAEALRTFFAEISRGHDGPK